MAAAGDEKSRWMALDLGFSASRTLLRTSEGGGQVREFWPNGGRYHSLTVVPAPARAWRASLSMHASSPSQAAHGPLGRLR